MAGKRQFLVSVKLTDPEFEVPGYWSEKTGGDIISRSGKRYSPLFVAKPFSFVSDPPIIAELLGLVGAGAEISQAVTDSDYKVSDVTGNPVVYQGIFTYLNLPSTDASDGNVAQWALGFEITAIGFQERN